MKLKIKVTKDILEKSKMCGSINLPNTKNCAIALAIRDIFPFASVGGSYFRPFMSGDYNLQIPLQQKVTNYIVKFDNTEPLLRPLLPEFEFEIFIPDEVIAKINIDEIKPLLENNPTLELIN